MLRLQRVVRPCKYRATNVKIKFYYGTTVSHGNHSQHQVHEHTDHSHVHDDDGHHKPFLEHPYKPEEDLPVGPGWLPEPKKQSLRIFTRAEVGKHNTREDAWIILKDKVYNVTTWIPLHPGGEFFLLQKLGGDLSAEIDRTYDHSWQAIEQMNKLQLGAIDREKEPPRHDPAHWQQLWEQKEPSIKGDWW